MVTFILGFHYYHRSFLPMYIQLVFTYILCATKTYIGRSCCNLQIKWCLYNLIFYITSLGSYFIYHWYIPFWYWFLFGIMVIVLTTFTWSTELQTNRLQCLEPIANKGSLIALWALLAFCPLFPVSYSKLNDNYVSLHHITVIQASVAWLILILLLLLIMSYIVY